MFGTSYAPDERVHPLNTRVLVYLYTESEPCDSIDVVVVLISDYCGLQGWVRNILFVWVEAYKQVSFFKTRMCTP